MQPHSIAALIMTVYVSSFVWFMLCVFQTHRDRAKLRDWVFRDGAAWPDRAPKMNAVRVDQHHLRLLLLCNPWKLYDPEVRDAMK